MREYSILMMREYSIWLTYNTKPIKQDKVCINFHVILYEEGVRYSMKSS